MIQKMRSTLKIMRCYKHIYLQQRVENFFAHWVTSHARTHACHQTLCCTCRRYRRRRVLHLIGTIDPLVWNSFFLSRKKPLSLSNITRVCTTITIIVHQILSTKGNKRKRNSRATRLLSKIGQIVSDPVLLSPNLLYTTGPTLSYDLLNVTDNRRGN
jgi:hypothetical protein